VTRMCVATSHFLAVVGVSFLEPLHSPLEQVKLFHLTRQMTDQRSCGKFFLCRHILEGLLVFVLA
jgi:hypothetical protein